MDIAVPNSPDVNKGTAIVTAGWVLTAIVALLLLFRVAMKTWIGTVLSPSSRPRKVWGLEDIFLFAGFACDVAHQSLIWESYQNGLGRHFFYLTPEERRIAMKWDWIAAQLAVTAVTLSRTGIMCFLYSCFARNRKGVAQTLLVCIALHTAVNLVTVLQAIMQCGPNPYRISNRAAYYHYLWDPLPEDGSVVCESPQVQTNIGYGQSALNVAIDFMLVALAALEIWHFLFLGHNDRLRNGIVKLRKLDRTTRRQRFWQTLFMCGPLALSGIACIVKAPLVGAIGERGDITWNLMPLILWVKIENYTVPLGASAALMRLTVKLFTNRECRPGGYGYSSGHRSQAVELSNHVAGPWEQVTISGKKHGASEAEGRSLHGSEASLVDNNIHVRMEYEVRVVGPDGQEHSPDSRSTVTACRGEP